MESIFLSVKASPQTMSVLTLACLFFGDGANKIFMVKVLETEDVNNLKEIIWAKHANLYPFSIVDAKKLVLWKVSLPPIQPYAKLSDIQLSDHIRLSQPGMKLFEVQGLRRAPDENYIVIVETPAGMA